MKTAALVLVLALSGCAGLRSGLDTLFGPSQGSGPDPVAVAQAEVEARRNAVAALQLSLKSAEAAETPNLPQVQADLQVAQTELAAAEAQVVKARVSKGFGYAEVAAKVISTPLQVFFPMAGPALTGLLGLLGAARSFFGGTPKPEAK